MDTPRQSLRTQHHQLRRGELVKILDAIEAGQSVRDSDLRGLLKDHYQDYRNALASNQSLKDQAQEKPSRIADYEALLSEADRLYGQMDSLSRQGHEQSAKQIGAKASKAYERALERLEEVLRADPSLQMWLDRPVVFDLAAGGFTLDPVDVPRCFTSESPHNLGSVANWGVRDKADIIAEAVNAAIDKIDELLAPEITRSEAVKSSGALSPQERLARVTGR